MRTSPRSRKCALAACFLDGFFATVITAQEQPPPSTPTRSEVFRQQFGQDALPAFELDVERPDGEYFKPHAIDLSGGVEAAPMSGLIESPAEYDPVGGVIFRYGGG